MNLAKLLSLRAQSCGNKRAILFETTPYTYADLDVQVRRRASMLAALGVLPGDRVAIQLPKSMEFIFLELAVMSVGGVVLPLNVDYKADEVDYFLSDSESSLFITDSARRERARRVLSKLPRLEVLLVDDFAGEKRRTLRDELPKATPDFERSYPSGDDDPAMIIYTSGTTGRSKGAVLSHKNLIANTEALYRVWEWSERDVLLHVLPLFHVHGLFVALHGGLYAGATIIMHEKFDPLRTWQTIESERCTMLMGVPTIYQRLLHQWDMLERKPDLSSMRVFISGSAPLLENLFNRFEQATGFRILERYGMTEAGMIASNPIQPERRKARSVGYPLPGVEARIVSESGIDVAPGQVGEVWIRGDSVFKGYWKMPEKTRESFHEGWFKTGDLGFQDPEDLQRLYLVGRSKELIISGGYNVYPKEIEDVLETHEAVKEAAVVGVPDEDFGEKVVAFVALREDASASEADLITHCKERLAGYKCPKHIIQMDVLPRNAMGKLQKNVLQKSFLESGQS
ncbi:MAG: AMP-binding protein [Desulfomonilaceae bacterium]